MNADLPTLLQIDALAERVQSKHSEIGLTVCNQTEANSWISIGYREDGSWQSRGWWSLEPAGCIRPWSKDLIGAEMHLYAQQDGADNKIRVLKNPVDSVNNFCVAEGKFSALGREFCIDQGYVTANFRPIPVEESGLKITLTHEDFAETSRGVLR